MKIRVLLLLGALFATPLSAGKGEFPDWFTGKGYTLQVISPCKHCGLQASNPAQLKLHIYSVHTTKSPGSMECGYVGCGKTFKTKKDLMGHISTGDHDIKKNKMHKGCGCG